MSNDCQAYLNPVAHIQCVAEVANILVGYPVIFDDKKTDQGDYQYTLAEFPSLSFTSPLKRSSSFFNFLTISCANTTEKWKEADEEYYKKHESLHLTTYFNANSSGQTLIKNRATPLIQALSHKLVDIFGGTLYAHDAHFYGKEKTYEVKEGSFLPFYVDDEDEGFLARHHFYQTIEPIPSALIKQYQSISPYAYQPDEFEKILHRFVEIEYQRLNHQIHEKDNHIHGEAKNRLSKI
jgi:hypothetical protein